MARKWLEGAAGLRQEAVTKSFTKSAGKRAYELISSSFKFSKASGESLALKKFECQRSIIIIVILKKKCNSQNDKYCRFYNFFIDFFKTGDFF